MSTNQQRIGVRVPGGPKRTGPNWPTILAWLGIAALVALNLFMGGCAATKAPQSYGVEPIGPYSIMEGGISPGTIYLEIYDPAKAAWTRPPCDHFFVLQAIPVDTAGGEFDPLVGDILDQLRAIDGWPCVCIKCSAKTTCY